MEITEDDLRSKKKLSVGTRLLFDSDNGMFIAGYGYRENMIKNLGSGKTLSDAFINLSEEVNSLGTENIREIYKKMSECEEIALYMSVFYYFESKEYVVYLYQNNSFIKKKEKETGGLVLNFPLSSRGDSEYKFVLGRGNNMSSAFMDIGEKL
jgi:hypothetical protein